MLRITQTGDTLKLEGKLVGPWVGALREVSASAGQVWLDLSAVSFIDTAGLTLLRDLLARGATVVSCSRLVEELLQREAQ
jgi:ABC-type transporter Mla MlaB component